MLVDVCYDGRVALVTGGGSGMGRAMAQEFARLGASVVVAGRRPEPLEETVALIEAAGGSAAAQPTDVRDPDQVEAMVAAAVERFGRVDCLVNNAAGNFVVKGEDLSPNGWRAVVSIVLDGGFLCTRAAGRQMIAQGGGGAVLSVIASYAWTGGPGTVHSASAKAGLLAMTKTLAVDTARVERSVPAGRLATVEEIAWWSTALCSDFGSYVTGMNFTIDGGHWLEQDSYMPSLKPRD